MNYEDPDTVFEIALDWGVALSTALAFVFPITVAGLHFYAAFTEFSVPAELNTIGFIAGVIATFIVIFKKL